MPAVSQAAAKRTTTSEERGSKWQILLKIFVREFIYYGVPLLRDGTCPMVNKKEKKSIFLFLTSNLHVSKLVYGTGMSLQEQTD